MENSNNSINKAPKYNISSNNNNNNNIDQSPEESSWTMYLEDFLIQSNNEHSNYSVDYISGYESSQISDAGSSVNNGAKKLVDDEEINNVRFGINFNKGYYCNRLSFKKRKTIEANLVIDDSLEDTASSPVNSPKVFSLSKMGVKPKDDYYHNNMFDQDKGISNSGGEDYQRSHEQLDGFIGRESDCTELKKKGLCLVPLSMIVNFLG